MSRSVFYSFHYQPDNARAAQVRNAGVVDGNQPVSDNGWESITQGGDSAIEKWIDGQMSGKSCAVVLIGSRTAGRKWINYEITKAWNDGRGVLGVYIHNLKNFAGEQSTKGGNPLDFVTVNGTKLSIWAEAIDPPFTTSTVVYEHIKTNLADWVERAITIRKGH